MAPPRPRPQPISYAEAARLIRLLAQDPGRIVFWQHALDAMEAAQVEAAEVLAALCACEVQGAEFKFNLWRYTAEGPAGTRMLSAPVIIERKEGRLQVVTVWEVR